MCKGNIFLIKYQIYFKKYDNLFCIFLNSYPFNRKPPQLSINLRNSLGRPGKTMPGRFSRIRLIPEKREAYPDCRDTPLS